jgi:hypothetical protein
MSPLGWTLTAVVTFSAGWLLIPLIAAWVSHSGRPDPALERMGRPFRRLADWLARHPRTIGVIVALLGILYGAAAWTALRDGQHFMVVLAIVNGIGLCLSLLAAQRNLREADQAWRRRHQQGPVRREEGSGW